MAKSTLVKRTGIVRKKGYLYFIDKLGDVRKTVMARGRRRKKK